MLNNARAISNAMSVGEYEAGPSFPGAVRAEGMKLIRVLKGTCSWSDSWPHVESFIAETFRALEQTQTRLSLEAICNARTEVLETLQAYFGETPQWSFIRNRALNAFGRSGLARRL